MFYTYLWLREDGTPYYVGKGKGLRAYYRQRSYGVHPPLYKERIIVQEFESEEDAFTAEKFLIYFYGRKDLGRGVLYNMTDGGEGPSGMKRPPRTEQYILKQRLSHANQKPSEETKAKIGKTQSLVRKGMKFSEEHKRNIGIASSLRMMGNTYTKGKPWSAARREAQDRKNNASQGAKSNK